MWPDHQSPSFQKWIKRLQHHIVHLEQDRADALRHNVSTSRLCNLPDKLLLLILSYARPSAIALIRITSARFFDLIDDAAESLHRKDRALLQHMIFRDYFEESCKRERGLIGAPSSKNSVLCDACHYHHPESEFLPKELSKASDERSCIGAMGVLQICEHVVFTHATLRQNILEQSDRTGSAQFVCTHPKHGIGKTPYAAADAPTFGILEYGGQTERPVQEDCYSITWHRQVFTIPRWMPVVKARYILPKFLKTADSYICPHLRSGSPAVINAIPKEDCPNMETHVDPRSCSTCTLSAFKTCAAPDCGTEFCLYRRPNYSETRRTKRGVYARDYDSVMLVTYRRLGPLLDAADPRWRRQVLDVV